MFYHFNLSNLPIIKTAYSVSRNTFWQVADSYNILIFISSGCCEIIFNNESFILEKGDIFFVPAKQSYKRCPINGIVCTMHYIHFSTNNEPIQTEASALQNSIAKTLERINIDAISDQPIQYPNTIYLESRMVCNDYDTLKNMVDSINLFSVNRHILCGLESQVNLSRLLVYLSHRTIKTLVADTNIKNSVSFPKKLTTALNYIVTHVNKQITLDELAEHCHISKHQLIRYFKNSLGTTPIMYINDYKIARAKEMLTQQLSLSIKAISEELGFSNQYYFTKVFTNATGVTPSTHRSQTTNYYKKNKEKDDK